MILVLQKRNGLTFPSTLFTGPAGERTFTSLVGDNNNTSDVVTLFLRYTDVGFTEHFELVKVNLLTGQIIWQQEINGKNDLYAYTNSSGYITTFHDKGQYIRRFDPDGNIVWSKHIQISATHSYITYCAEDDNSNLYYACSGGNQNAKEVRLMKLATANGAVTWSRITNSSTDVSIHQTYSNSLAVHNTNGNVYIAYNNATSGSDLDSAQFQTVDSSGNHVAAFRRSSFPTRPAGLELDSSQSYLNVLFADTSATRHLYLYRQSTTSNSIVDSKTITYFQSAGPAYPAGKLLSVASDGSIYILGYATLGSVTGYVIFKFDSNLVFQWAIDLDNSISPYSIAARSSGLFVVAGYGVNGIVLFRIPHSGDVTPLTSCSYLANSVSVEESNFTFGTAPSLSPVLTSYATNSQSSSSFSHTTSGGLIVPTSC